MEERERCYSYVLPRTPHGTRYTCIKGYLLNRLKLSQVLNAHCSHKITKKTADHWQKEYRLILSTGLFKLTYEYFHTTHTPEGVAESSQIISDSFKTPTFYQNCSAMRNAVDVTGVELIDEYTKTLQHWLSGLHVITEQINRIMYFKFKSVHHL
jgi:hypothetical protein